MYGDQKLVDEIKHQLYHAILNAQNSLGEELAAEVIVHAFGNPDKLVDAIKVVQEPISFEPHIKPLTVEMPEPIEDGIAKKIMKSVLGGAAI